jgi:hypothetical protein
MPSWAGPQTNHASPNMLPNFVDLAGIFLPIGGIHPRSSSNRTPTIISSDGIQSQSISECFANATPSACLRHLQCFTLELPHSPHVRFPGRSPQRGITPPTRDSGVISASARFPKMRKMGKDNVLCVRRIYKDELPRGSVVILADLSPIQTAS